MTDTCVYYRQRPGQPLERFVDRSPAGNPLMDRCTWDAIPGTLDQAHDAALAHPRFTAQRFPFSHARSAHGPHTWDVLLCVPRPCPHCHPGQPCLLHDPTPMCTVCYLPGVHPDSLCTRCRDAIASLS